MTRIATWIALLTAVLAGVAGAQRIEPLDHDRRTPVVQVFQAARDAVVSISTTRLVSTMGGFLGGGDPFDDVFDMPFDRRVPVQGLGSGFVIHPSGYIVTNEHVIRRAEKVTVTLADGRECPATVIASDPEHDLAVLRIDPPDGQIAALTLGRSDDLLIGETVVAIGNPLGYRHTLTAGVVSALEREMIFPGGIAFRGLIQTDASINPGSSGGPLLNINAEVIGINSAIRADAQGIGFAIPVSELARDLPRLLDYERLNRLVCGLVVEQGTAPDDGTALVVRQVAPGSPAATAGVRPGDGLLALDGQPVASIADFCVAMLGKQPGQTIACRAATRGEDGRPSTVTYSIVLAERPRPDGHRLAMRWLGLDAEAVTPDAARRLRLATERGLVITRIVRGGVAERVGLEVGDVLFQLGRSYVLTPDDLGTVLEDVEPGQVLRIGIVRGRYRIWGQIQASTKQESQGPAPGEPVPG